MSLVSKCLPEVSHGWLNECRNNSKGPPEEGKVLTGVPGVDRNDMVSTLVKNVRYMPKRNGKLSTAYKSFTPNRPGKGGVIAETEFQEIGKWDDFERVRSSTWRETEAVSRVIKSNAHVLKNKIQKSKTDIYRSGKEVSIAKGCSVACPYSMLQKYMTAAHLSVISDSYLFKPAFRSKGKSSLIKLNKKSSYTRAKECIVKKLKVVAPSLKLGTHSLRASGATMAANASGVSDRCLKRHGRWKTDVAKDGYIEDSVEKRLYVT